MMPLSYIKFMLFIHFLKLRSLWVYCDTGKKMLLLQKYRQISIYLCVRVAFMRMSECVYFTGQARCIYIFFFPILLLSNLGPKRIELSCRECVCFLDRLICKMHLGNFFWIDQEWKYYHSFMKNLWSQLYSLL